MFRHNDDYIPTYADIEHERIACQQRIKGVADPRNAYLCKFTIEDKQYEEKVYAYDLKSAEEHLKQQWGMVGMIVRNLVTVPVKEDK